MTIQPGGTEELQETQEPTVVYMQEPAGRRWGRRLLILVGTIGVIIALVFGLKAVDLWPNIKNPFATQKTDRSGPVLLESIQDLSRYVAAEGNFQVLVDLQENKSFIPDIIFNQRTLFVGVGSVDAYVDFSSLNEGAIVVSPDGKTVDMTLPAPQLEKPSLDTEKSYVFAEERGLVNRVGDLVGNDPNKQQQLYQLAEQKIADAARDSELRSRAEKNTKLMLESLLKGLGFERVNITFKEP
jgi:predicted ester cyclase